MLAVKGVGPQIQMSVFWSVEVEGRCSRSMLPSILPLNPFHELSGADSTCMISNLQGAGVN